MDCGEHRRSLPRRGAPWPGVTTYPREAGWKTRPPLRPSSCRSARWPWRSIAAAQAPPSQAGGPWTPASIAALSQGAERRGLEARHIQGRRVGKPALRCGPRVVEVRGGRGGQLPPLRRRPAKPEGPWTAASIAALSQGAERRGLELLHIQGRRVGKPGATCAKRRRDIKEYSYSPFRRRARRRVCVGCDQTHGCRTAPVF